MEIFVISYTSKENPKEWDYGLWGLAYDERAALEEMNLYKPYDDETSDRMERLGNLCDDGTALYFEGKMLGRPCHWQVKSLTVRK